ncbi:MAG TPA: choline kinase family protein [Phycicoccus sp.]|nr:choline kinase family protein [Phycicoccus sp.]
MATDLDRQLDGIPALAGQDREITALPGGLTNRNYRVRTAAHDVVVRISPASSGLLAIDRDQEMRNTRAAARAGVGPGVVDHRRGEGILVVEFIPDALTYDDALVGANLPRVAAAVRTLHAGPEFVGRFDMFAIQRRYEAVMREHGWRMPEGYAALAPLAARMAAALGAHPEPLVPCHNDLLAANFLDTGDRIWIIDYEYSGMNEASFELGNLIQEAHLGPDDLTELVSAYVGREDPVATARAAVWGIVSAYAWTLWGTIQAGLGDIDYDFWSWAMDKFERARAAMTAPGFGRLLDTVGEGR